MAARTQRQSQAYQAWTYILAGLLALTNAAWFLSSRIKASDHAAALNAAAAARAEHVQVEERVVYRERDPNSQPMRQLEALRQERARAQGRVLLEQAQTAFGKENVRCYGSTLMVRQGDAWSSAGTC